MGIKVVLWGVLGDQEHRMKHWLQLVAIPNAPDSSSKQELNELKKRMAAGEPTSSFPISAYHAERTRKGEQQRW